MDINFKLEDTTFNFRVGAIIRDNNYILLEYNTVYNYYSFIGGRVKIGEDTSKAVEREFWEETNIPVKVDKLKGIVENFFFSNYAMSYYHELLYIYEVKFVKEKLDKEMINLEDNNRIFKWVPIDSLCEDNFRPSVVFKYLNNEEFFHIINKD